MFVFRFIFRTMTTLLAALAGLSGYLVTAVRNAEDILPDHSGVAQETNMS